MSRHIRELVDDGYSPTAIAMVAGVDRTTVANLSASRYPTTSRATAWRLLAVTVTTILDRVPSEVRVPTIGATRRIRALQALGWPQSHIAATAELTVGAVDWASRHPDGAVPARTHRAIDWAYGQLSMLRGPSERTAAHAARAGWPPPLAWDDHEIDVPTASPHNPNGAADPKGERDQAIIDLTRRGRSSRIIAEIVGCSDRTVVRIRKRSRAAA